MLSGSARHFDSEIARMQWTKDSISLDANKRARIPDHKKTVMNNVIDDGSGHFDKEIDMTGLGDLEETKAGNTKPQVGCFVCHVDHGATAMLSGNARHLTTRSAGLVWRHRNRGHQAPSETFPSFQMALL